jgi:hypothetical protein
MSTTTDIHESDSAFALVRPAGLTLAAWLALVAVITVVAEPMRDAVVFGAPEQTLALLTGSDTRIVDVQPTYLVVRGVERGFVRALYANGAWIVLPARSGSCLAIPKRQAVGGRQA